MPAVLGRTVSRLHPNTILGGLAIAFGLVLLLIWVPLDAENGIVYTRRGTYNIGDGLAPAVAAFFFIIPGLMLAFGPKADGAPRLTRADATYVLCLVSVTILAIVVMRYAGPLLALSQEMGYRPLRATTPWKYTGFILGGTVLVSGIIALVEGRITARGLIIGAASAIAIALLYDLPFEDLLLPPNGDV